MRAAPVIAPPPSSAAAIDSSVRRPLRRVKRLESVDSGTRPASIAPTVLLAASIVPEIPSATGLARTTTLRSVAGSTECHAERSMCLASIATSRHGVAASGASVARPVKGALRALPVASSVSVASDPPTTMSPSVPMSAASPFPRSRPSMAKGADDRIVALPVIAPSGATNVTSDTRCPSAPPV
jgi:hypothetical protein